MPLKKGVRLSYLLPELTENKLRYYTYKGSITTPPCYESVRWFVMKSPIAITKQQVTASTSRLVELFVGFCRTIKGLL